MKTLINESIELMTKVKDNLMLIKKHYPYLNNIEYEICENINKSDELISELKTLSKILILSPDKTHIIVDDCPACDGDGYSIVWNDGYRDTVKCGRCNGTKQIQRIK